MIKYYILLFCAVLIFNGCSTSNRLIRKHNYSEAINQTFLRLDEDPYDLKAGQMLKKYYLLALEYYQNEIDQIQKSGGSFMATKTLDYLIEVKRISDRVQKNPFTRDIIGEAKDFDSEISEIKPKALDELYSAGVDVLNIHSVEKAKEAFRYFKQVVKHDPEYKDARKKMVEARTIASVKVIVGSVHLDSRLKLYTASKFDENLMYKLRYDFPNRDFFEFYTTDEAIEKNIVNPDKIVTIDMEDFKMSPVYGVNGTYQSSPGNNLQQTENYILNTTGTLLIRVFSAKTNDVLYKDRISFQEYVDKKSTSYKDLRIQIQNNPDTQWIFDALLLANTSQITDRLAVYFSTIN